MTSESGTMSIDGTRRFAQALRNSIDDKKLETAGERLFFFFDTDVATNAIVGLTSWTGPQGPPDIHGRSNLVHALLTTGFLPAMYFLRPHLAELYRKLQSLPDTDMLVKFHTGAMQYLANAWGLPRDEAELRNRVSNAQGFYEFIQEEGYDIFVKLELCLGGHWKSRLSRLHRHRRLRIEAPWPNEAEIVPNDAVAHDLAPRISELRGLPNLTVNDQVDALALAELARLIKRGHNVRFFSETESLRQLFASPDAVDGLFKANAGGSVFRDEEYFVVRTSFPALGFQPESRRLPKSNPASAFSIGELEELLASLDSLLLVQSSVDNEREFADVLAKESFKGRPLGALLNDFHRLQFLSSVFLTWDPPPELREWLPSLYTATAASGIADETRGLVNTSLGTLWERMSDEIHYLTEWRREFPIILGRANKRAAAHNGVVPGLWLDIGLAQWGLDTSLPADVQQRLADTVREIVDAASHARNSLCSDIALMVVRAKARTMDLAYGICVLWFLRLYEMVGTLYDGSDAAERQGLPLGVHVIALLSKTRNASHRARKHGTSIEEELQNAIEEAEGLVNVSVRRGNPFDAAYARMGLSRVAYLAWDNQRDRAPDIAESWARKSFEAARAAAAGLPEGSLAWAFAINHCAHLAIRTHLFREEAFLFMGQLIDKIPPEYDHFRFRNVKAWNFTAKVEAHFTSAHRASRSLSPESDEVRRELCAQLLSATELLEGVSGFGDDEFTKHRELVAHYASFLNCRVVLERITGRPEIKREVNSAS
jgi:hypothetical protein